jgi:hypothetical protein
MNVGTLSDLLFYCFYEKKKLSQEGCLFLLVTSFVQKSFYVTKPCHFRQIYIVPYLYGLKFLNASFDIFFFFRKFNHLEAAYHNKYDKINTTGTVIT